MHTVKVLHKLLRQSVPAIHATRLMTLMAAVQALTRGANARVTSLGRGLCGQVYAKHKIKRMDRLLSNENLYQETYSIYSALTTKLLNDLPEPIIAIDWSPLCADQSWQLLRAAIPVGGRSLTLYEEVHPQSKLGNRKIQHRFLNKLASMMPDTCCPIIVADSGFKTPFYRYIEDRLAWHWVGRIRGRDLLSWDKHKGAYWFNAHKLHNKATTVAACLGFIQWTKQSPLSAFIVLVRQAKKQRSALTLKGKKRQSKVNKVHARRQKEPWLLVASLSLRIRTPKQLVKIYRTRMQIEEGFRDCKAVHYGLCLSQNRRMNKQRRTVLCLIAACAIFILWCIGIAGKQTTIAKQVRVNSSSKREPYSAIFLARLLIAQTNFRLPDKAIKGALNNIKPYMDLVLCE
jgi:hypothetical protein